jgi:hypothetical protein
MYCANTDRALTSIGQVFSRKFPLLKDDYFAMVQCSILSRQSFVLSSWSPCNVLWIFFWHSLRVVNIDWSHSVVNMGFPSSHFTFSVTPWSVWCHCFSLCIRTQAQESSSNFETVKLFITMLGLYTPNGIVLRELGPRVSILPYVPHSQLCSFLKAPLSDIPLVIKKKNIKYVKFTKKYRKISEQITMYLPPDWTNVN